MIDAGRRTEKVEERKDLLSSLLPCEIYNRVCVLLFSPVDASDRGCYDFVKF